MNRILRVLAVLVLAVTTLEATVTMTITPANTTISVGQTVQLVPNPTFPKQHWSISDSSVATITTYGAVTGVAAGSATVTVSYKNYRGTTSVTVVDNNPMSVLCPANKAVNSTDGGAVTTTYSATSSGGTAPVVLVYSPASGSSFVVGQTTVTVTGTDAAGRVDTCQFNVLVTDTSVQADWVGIATNALIQTAISDNPAGTTFLLATGNHSITSAIVPKSGDVFIGSTGAVIDGAGWVTADTTQGAFRAWNVDVDDVTIQNLKIQHMPQKGIAVSGHNSTGWTIDTVEVTTCTRDAVNVPDNSVLKNSNIHHNTYGGYTLYLSHDVTFQNNTITYNGTEQKVVGTQRVYFLNNTVTHNTGDGIWFDTDNTGWVIDGNTVEDNGRMGIHIEISGQGIIRNNSVKRSADTGIFIVMSKNADIYANTLVDNFRGIRYYIKCTVAGGGTIGWDLASDSAHDNTITVPSTSGAWANGINAPSGSCTAAQALPYYDGTKMLTFTNNHYVLPALTSRYWIWDTAFKSFTEWQTLGNDTAGTAQ